MSRLLAAQTAFDKVTLCLVRLKTNSPSPAQRSVQAGVQKPIPYHYQFSPSTVSRFLLLLGG